MDTPHPLIEQEGRAAKMTWKRALRRVFSRENVLALALCLIVVLVVIVTADASPQWIYQGF